MTLCFIVHVLYYHLASTFVSVSDKSSLSWVLQLIPLYTFLVYSCKHRPDNVQTSDVHQNRCAAIADCALLFTLAILAESLPQLGVAPNAVLFCQMLFCFVKCCAHVS